MNTEITVTAPELTAGAERDLATAVAHLFRETERRFSRFLPDSELARLNRATGPTAVSAELLELLTRARAHALATGGLFDAAVGAAMHAIGYDRSFAPGALDRDEAAGTVAYASVSMVDIDAEHRRVTRPPHIQIDFGGFLKGLTADRAAALAPGAVVIDAGGDAVLHGAGIVEIEDPRDAARTIGVLTIRDRAVATSAGNRRRWRRGSQMMHHIIDPRTGAPARTDLIQATVLAPTAEVADIMAKVAFVSGSAAAIPELERRGLSAVLVLHGGAIRTAGTVDLHHA